MSVSTEVQRTLVKSPPELWTELSNPEALARHLGEFGEIRITAVEPETKVEWEAEEASGVVQLKQSGWGTKVTLSVTRSPTVPEPAIAVEPEPAIAAEAEPEPVLEVEPETTITAEPEPEPAIVAESEPIAAEPEPTPPSEPEATLASTGPEPVATAPESVAPDAEPQLGFFARLFRKRKAKPAAIVESEPEVIALAVPEPVEVVALAAPELAYPDPPQPEASEPAEDLASELESLEDQMAAETTELLTGVLDRLGAAHHRPFSRG